jgi:hypothetical protein
MIRFKIGDVISYANSQHCEIIDLKEEMRLGHLCTKAKVKYKDGYVGSWTLYHPHDHDKFKLIKRGITNYPKEKV